MKKIFAFVFGLGVVLYLSASIFAQGKAGGYSPDHDKFHVRTEGREDHKDVNFEARIERNPALKAKVESMLPAGMTLKTAASGFRNEGQFIAALHVSKNLGIPFDQLKAKMT